MAMVGMGSRIPRVMLAHPAAIGRLLPCSAVDETSCWTKRHLGSLTTRTLRRGTADSVFGSPACLESESNGRTVLNALPQRTFVRALDVSGPGSVDSPLMKSMQSKIQNDLNAESVTVTDAYGDGRHVSIDVVASTFEGKSAVNRQRLVYKAIWEELQDKVHAVDQLKTRTPNEASNAPKKL